jgi:hypothetical protein
MSRSETISQSESIAYTLVMMRCPLFLSHLLPSVPPLSTSGVLEAAESPSLRVEKNLSNFAYHWMSSIWAEPLESCGERYSTKTGILLIPPVKGQSCLLSHSPLSAMTLRRQESGGGRPG